MTNQIIKQLLILNLCMSLIYSACYTATTQQACQSDSKCQWRLDPMMNKCQQKELGCKAKDKDTCKGGCVYAEATKDNCSADPTFCSSQDQTTCKANGTTCEYKEAADVCENKSDFGCSDIYDLKKCGEKSYCQKNKGCMFLTCETLSSEDCKKQDKNCLFQDKNEFKCLPNSDYCSNLDIGSCSNAYCQPYTKKRCRNKTPAVICSDQDKNTCLNYKQCQLINYGNSYSVCQTKEVNCLAFSETDCQTNSDFCELNTQTWCRTKPTVCPALSEQACRDLKNNECTPQQITYACTNKSSDYPDCPSKNNETDCIATTNCYYTETSCADKTDVQCDKKDVTSCSAGGDSLEYCQKKKQIGKCQDKANACKAQTVEKNCRDMHCQWNSASPASCNNAINCSAQNSYDNCIINKDACDWYIGGVCIGKETSKDAMSTYSNIIIVNIISLLLQFIV